MDFSVDQSTGIRRRQRSLDMESTGFYSSFSDDYSTTQTTQPNDDDYFLSEMTKTTNTERDFNFNRPNNNNTSNISKMMTKTHRRSSIKAKIKSRIFSKSTTNSNPNPNPKIMVLPYEENKVMINRVYN